MGVVRCCTVVLAWCGAASIVSHDICGYDKLCYSQCLEQEKLFMWRDECVEIVRHIASEAAVAHE